MSYSNEDVILKPFSELNNHELYKIIQLRIEVFIIEQDCPFQDLDNLDQISNHYWIEEEGTIISYLRVVPPANKSSERHQFKEPSIGRIVTKQEYRKKGIAEFLINKAIDDIALTHGLPIRIGAQCYLEEYYQKFGFVRASEDYLEDDILHLEMLKSD